MVGELIGALAEFLSQTVNPFARWAKRGRGRSGGGGADGGRDPRTRLRRNLVASPRILPRRVRRSLVLIHLRAARRGVLGSSLPLATPKLRQR